MFKGIENQPKGLKFLRAVIKEKKPIQQQLDLIVDLVAEQLKVAVCSCYLLRPGDMLELFASHGLDKKAIHETFLRVGEGLVGEVALQKKTLNFEDAWAHPSFVYKPETKEKSFKSLLGVPILRNGHLMGVISVQTEYKNKFSNEMIWLLENIAMVIAELLVNGQEKNKTKKMEGMRIHKKMEGISLVPGVSVGEAFVHQRTYQTGEILAKDSKNEVKKFFLALKEMEEQINKMMTTSDITTEEADIIGAYLKFIQDNGWRKKIISSIEKGLTAQVSVQKVMDEIEDRMSQISDPYIKERIHDFKDLSHRLIRHLQGLPTKGKNKKIPKNIILVAESLGPAELLDYDVKKIKALILQEGSQAMHVVIVARSLNIPVVGSIREIHLINSGDTLAINGKTGEVFVNPSDEILDEFDKEIQEQKRILFQYEQQQNLPSITKDGFKISLNANVGLSGDLLNLQKGMYDGVGLYRTELPFLMAEQLPDTQKQVETYKQAIRYFGEKPILFRTLDIGSDKVLPYFNNQGEENPALGWRSIRITLDRRSLLREQLRAFIRSVEGKKLYVMFPMISDIDEFIEAKRTLDVELEREKQCGGKLPQNVYVGTMLEVPSLIFQLNSLLPIVDFISIGTNDLMQFLFAVDRANPVIWEKYDPLSPALLKVLKYINEMCEKADVPCSVCGEMAGKPLEAMALIALGFKSLSMNPNSLGAVKTVVRTMSKTKTAQYLENQLETREHSLREKLKAYALDHDVFI